MPDTYHVEEVKRTDTDKLQPLVDLINAGSQLSWVLTPSRLLSKIGPRGRIFGLFDSSGNPMGVIALKQTQIGDYDTAELGYLYLDPSARGFQNAILLYKAALKVTHSYDFVFATTNSTNKTVNTLLARTNKMQYAFKAKSPYSSNILYYWIVLGNSRLTEQMKIQALVDEYKDNIIGESDMVVNEGLWSSIKDFYYRMRDSYNNLITTMENAKVTRIELKLVDPENVKPLSRRLKALMDYKGSNKEQKFVYNQETQILTVTNTGVSGIYVNGFLKAVRNLAVDYDFHIVGVY